MPVFEIESNGMIEDTLIHINGRQISGLKEIFVNIDEDGTFDSLIKYTGSDGKLYTKNIFSDFLDNLQLSAPTLTVEEAQNLRPLTIDSDGSLENTIVAIDDYEQDGVVSLFVHIVAPSGIKKPGFTLFKKEESDYSPGNFVAEITYRNTDNSVETEKIF